MDKKDSDLYAAVYGELFASAKTQMEMIDRAIENQKDIGFKTAKECAVWAKEHLLDMAVVVRSQHRFMYLSHRGEPFTLTDWKRYYCHNILFTWKYTGENEREKVPWVPLDYEYHNNAKILGEQEDGIREPIQHRDYFTPTGFFDPLTNTFNRARPFPVNAKQTGRDTSHIYRYIENIAGVCAPWLLAWLRHKCLYPKRKSEVVPVIVSRTQGNGKSTFGTVLCTGLFGKDNVLVTDQYDANARFNSDYADALIVCAEEKEEEDKRNPVTALKSRTTATMIRKEHKGIDPIYQENYTEFVVTTNKDVPIKFDGAEDQRRFMVMGSNPKFTRKTSPLADEVFSKLYGFDGNNNKVGVPFVDDHELIAQFKHELYSNEEIAKVNLKAFPHTPEYERCISLPRTTENTEIDSILRSLAPFIRASLLEHRLVPQVPADDGQMLSLASFVTTTSAIQFMPAYNANPEYIAVCRPLIFYDQQTAKPFTHAVVERGIIDCTPWLLAEYGIRLLPSQLPIPGGFMNVMTRYRNAPAARFVLADDAPIDFENLERKSSIETAKTVIVKDERIGSRLRVNSKWQPDPYGEYETVNELKPGTTSLLGKSNNVQYMDTFLFEADDVSKQIYALEQTRLKGSTAKQAATVFLERLRLQKAESDRLLDSGIAFRVVYSGGKSYHVLVRIKDAPSTLDEYKWLHAHLCDGVISKKLDYDPQCNDPARLTRAPIEHDRIFEYNGVTVFGKQHLYREIPGQVFDYNWRSLYEQWKNRPLEPYEMNGRKLRPAKQEYKDAMWALLNGSFWTDGTWNGRRQQCFFPAYRLCRLVGFDHDTLWTEQGILDGLNRYYRRTEIDYWRTRESSEIIRQIDIEVQQQLEDENGL